MGTSGSNYDLSLTDPTFGRDLHFKTRNLALFVENLWKLHPRFSVTTGMRMESGESRMTGSIGYYPSASLPNTIKHSFPLFGINAQYDLSSAIQAYGGWSQAYRPVIFKDIIPASVFEISDKNLKDASGYNAEIGFRGKWKFLKWDLSGFYLQYNHRLGTLAQTDGAGNLQIFRTNIGNSGTAGLEIFCQADMRTGPKGMISIFTSTSLMDARYQTASLRSGNENVDLKNKKVESVPQTISRNGLTFKLRKLNLSGLYSYTSESFADALNARNPNPSGATGLVPSYALLDFNASFLFTENIKLQINVSNVLDKQYFTKRPQFYPGPGIWPSDGRTFSMTVSVRI
jgi:Fe(3+) dicitrate transport protein